LVRAVEDHLAGARVTGLAAGLHAIVRLPRAVDGAALIRAARDRSVAVYPLGFAYISPRAADSGLVLGYANLSESAIGEGVRRLAGALAEVYPLGGRDGELARSAAGSSGSRLDE
jgi:GntR family transcriptional regulator/MocR family aminotransferase